MGKQTLIQLFNRYYLNQEDYVEIDVSAFERNLDHNLSKLKRNPYTILSFTNLHMANDTLLQYIKQSITKGYFEKEATKIDLRHCIVIMQGDFQLRSKNNLHFEEETKPLRNVEKALGKSFMEVFDEVFIFQDLQIHDKVYVVREMLRRWNKTMEETAIMEAVETSESLEEAARKLRKKIVSA